MLAPSGLFPNCPQRKKLNRAGEKLTPFQKKVKWFCGEGTGVICETWAFEPFRAVDGHGHLRADGGGEGAWIGRREEPQGLKKRSAILAPHETFLLDNE
jgi:hypothetical protein